MSKELIQQRARQRRIVRQRYRHERDYDYCADHPEIFPARDVAPDRRVWFVEKRRHHRYLALLRRVDERFGWVRTR